MSHVFCSHRWEFDRYSLQALWPRLAEDVRGETALLHFLASTSLQRGDRKGQEAQQFQARGSTVGIFIGVPP